MKDKHSGKHKHKIWVIYFQQNQIHYAVYIMLLILLKTRYDDIYWNDYTKGYLYNTCASRVLQANYSNVLKYVFINIVVKIVHIFFGLHFSFILRAFSQ